MPHDIGFKNLSFNGNEVILLCISYIKDRYIPINAVITNRSFEMIKIPMSHFASNLGYGIVTTS